MTVDIDAWVPLSGSLPQAPAADQLYFLPTRFAAGGAIPETPLFLDGTRLVPKYARAVGVPVEFSLSGDDRKFLSEYSADPNDLVIALAMIGWSVDWIIAVVQIAVADHIARRGESEPQSPVPLEVSIAKIDRDSRVLKGVKVKGEAEHVIQAIRELGDLSD